MTSPADTTEPPAPTQRAADSGWAKVILGVVALVVAVLFVLPGFLAALFSRTSGAVIRSWNYGTWFIEVENPRTAPFVLRCEMATIEPAKWVMRRSMAIHDFYMWEYVTAGGMVETDDGG
ncbi:MAG TPA: hypothetical protein VG733_10380 [Chthoniobacteraceae bacterium]|nr:hypothetical protein [Chthoniobacteraceae bacterium]